MATLQKYTGSRYLDRDIGGPFTDIAMLLTRGAIEREVGGRSYTAFSADGEAVFGHVAKDGGERADVTLPSVVKNPNYLRS